MPMEPRGDRSPQLLVSVMTMVEAGAALTGGADVIDAKDPSRGALGAVDLETLRGIVKAVGASRRISAALGDAICEDAVGAAAQQYAGAGVDFVKIGLAPDLSAARATRLVAAAAGAVIGSPGRCGVVAAIYADRCRADLEEARALAAIAAGAGAAGVLLDTADKNGPGLLGVTTIAAVQSFLRAARSHGLLTGLAGRLSPDDVGLLSTTAVDVIGVRGAACDGGRSGRVSTARVRTLRDAMSEHRRHPV